MRRCLVLLITCFSIPSITWGAIPETISFQGLLTDGSGNIVADGPYDLVFKIHTTANTPGTDVWMEGHTGVDVTDGVFGVVLGSNGFPLSLPFDVQYWLSISVSGGSEFSPRTILTSAAYSLNARAVATDAATSASIADGAVATADLADNTVTTTKIQDGAVTAAKIPTLQVVKSVNGLNDAVALAAGTNIAIAPSGQTLTISATGIGGGDITAVTAGTGLTGGGPSGNVTLNIAAGGVTGFELAADAVTSTSIVDGGIATTDIGDGTVTAAKIPGGEVVKSVNSLNDVVVFVEGPNIDIVPSGQIITISATGVGGGDITSVTAGTGLSGGGLSGDVTLDITAGGVTETELADNAVNGQDSG
jgi:hypothetical protein